MPVPHWHDERLPIENRPVLILSDGWKSLFSADVVAWRSSAAAKTREAFETDAMPRYIEAQRWYATKGEAITRAAMQEHARWGEQWLLQLVELQGPAEAATYFVPLALAWEDRDDERLKVMTGSSVARVRQQAQVGVMADAFADESFCRALVAAIGNGDSLPGSSGTFRFEATHAFAALAGDDVASLPVGRPQAQSSNTIVTLGDRLFLKCYRRVRAGRNRSSRSAATSPTSPASRTRCRSPACWSTSTPKARCARSRSCRRTSPTRATAGT